MDRHTAQEIIKREMAENPEKVISAALQYSPSTAYITDSVRAVPGPLVGVAAATLKDALRGKDAASTELKMIEFAKILTGGTTA